jgi:SOS-response transcriptional repressor LexA
MFAHSAIVQNASTVVKCLSHHRADYRYRAMGSSADRLKEARVKSGYDSAKGAAEAMGVPVATYIQHENGSRGYPAKRAERYARFFRVTPEWLLYGKETNVRPAELGPRLFVIGNVQAGVFAEAWRWSEEEWEAFTGRADLGVPVQQRFGLKVAGDSMNELYPPGTILECIEYDGRELENGKRVIVQRTKVDGAVEATVKELVRDPDGIEWLVPRSTNPAHKAFRADPPDSPEIARVEIIGLVVASTRYE